VDLLSIAQTIWRHKKLMIPVLILTGVLAIYVVKIKPPVYESNASVLLTNPQSGATPTQMKTDPSLKTVNPYNTFVSYGDLDVVANAVMDLINSPAEAAPLVKQGVTEFSLQLSSDFGNPPIIEITSQGSSRQAAIQSANVLVAAVKNDLYQIQKAQGVNTFYMISSYEVVKPVQADPSSSGKLRSLIAVLALGALLGLVVISVADALDRRRRSVASWQDSSPETGGSRDLRGDPGPMAEEPGFADRPAPGPANGGRPQARPEDYEYRPVQGFPRR
jgi:uncharacterized protein involved in exopolysaccharide biosynthesis